MHAVAASRQPPLFQGLYHYNKSLLLLILMLILRLIQVEEAIDSAPLQADHALRYGPVDAWSLRDTFV